MFVQIPLWGFLVLIAFAALGAYLVAKIIYDNSKED